ncbi:MAG: SGNH/GDSL hydrolase family protein [Bacteroidota bacterium]|nr:SGNH/GDSL hydrolase family protein [Bacteroidota bacterium]MDP4206665.1 SGNH/GDSL hydrolase family protein [Bacteroidota bacterium]
MKLMFGICLCFMFLGQFSQAQDWPNLARFRDANAKLAPVAKNEARVVFMGNSITEGWINTCPDFFSTHSYVNRGISGQTTPQMLIRFRQDVINLNPSVVVILAGTNDIAGNTGPSTLEMIEDNLASMAELANAHGIKVILSSVLPVYDYPWRPGLNPAEKIVTLNKWIQEYAAKNNLTYLDYYSSLVDERKGMKAEYSKDGVHPNEAGYKVMMPLVEEAIKSVLSEN